MIDLHRIYRDRIIHAVTGGNPAMVFHVANNTALSDICTRLVQAETALTTLRAKGYGSSGMLLHEVAATVPEKG